MNKLLQKLEKASLVISSIAFALMVSVIVFNVFSRIITNASFLASEELSYLGFSWSVFIGVTVLFQRNALIAIGVLVDRLKPQSKRVVEIVIFICLAAANFIMIILSFQLANGAWSRPSPALKIPYFYMDIPATISFSLMFFYSVVFVVQLIKGDSIANATLEERL